MMALGVLHMMALGAEGSGGGAKQVTGNNEDTPGCASLERPRTREPTTTMP